MESYISQSQVNWNLQYTLRSSCELETHMVAVERVGEYIDMETEVSSLCITECTVSCCQGILRMGIRVVTSVTQPCHAIATSLRRKIQYNI